MWIGGYQIYANNSYYWMDAEAVDLDGLKWYPGDPNNNALYADACLVLYNCGSWIMADYRPPTLEFGILCEI